MVRLLKNYITGIKEIKRIFIGSILCIPFIPVKIES